MKRRGLFGRLGIGTVLAAADPLSLFKKEQAGRIVPPGIYTREVDYSFLAEEELTKTISEYISKEVDKAFERSCIKGNGCNSPSGIISFKK